jgi:hypothetical protein
MFSSKIICLLLVCFYYSASAQDTTTTKAPVKASTRFVTEDELNRNIPLHHIDTSFNRIEIFHNLYKNYTVFQDLGNVGTPSRPLLFTVDRQVGYRLSENPFEGYWMKPENTKFYNTKTPYTDLFYAQGSNELIYLLAKHSQNILPRWNVGADFQRITSLGFLAKQYTSLYNYQFFTRYTSKNKKYDLIAHATWNRGFLEESGGVASDSAFEALSGPNKKVTPNLFNSQTRFKSRTAYLKQYWRFGSLSSDIKETDTVYSLKSNVQLSYSIKAEEISYIFETVKEGDTNSLLLPHQYYDITPTTLDSMYNGKLENRVALDVFNNSESQLTDSTRNYLGLGVTHALIVTSQNPYVRNYQNIISDITFEKISLKNYTYSTQAYAAYNVSGYNSGDYKIKASASYRLPLLDVGISGMLQLYKPDNALLLFKSNQFIWDNNYSKTQVLQLGAHISTRMFKNNFHLVYHRYQLDNWIYANTKAIPEQYTKSINIQTAELSKTFQAWKFYFEHYIIYQNSSSDVIRMPDLSGRIRYYFQSRFKKMKFQIGVNVFYNSAYYANNYNPANRLFFLQNDRKVGNYPVVDPFITGEIKRAAFFAKYEHVNQDLFSSTGFYSTQHYPISLASFRMGVRWRFYD